MECYQSYHIEYSTTSVLHHCITPIIQHFNSINLRPQRWLNYSSGSIPRHSSADLHHSAHPRLSRGFRTFLLQPGQKSTGSSFQNSIDSLQCGQRTSKISLKVQRCISCPGHFSDIQYFSFDYCNSYVNITLFKRKNYKRQIINSK